MINKLPEHKTREIAQRLLDAQHTRHAAMTALELATEVVIDLKTRPIIDINAWATKLAADSCHPEALGGP